MNHLGFTAGGMMKKQWGAALVLLLLIPVVFALGTILSNLINPEIAAGHPDYVRNYHRLASEEPVFPGIRCDCGRVVDACVPAW